MRFTKYTCSSTTYSQKTECRRDRTRGRRCLCVHWRLRVVAVAYEQPRWHHREGLLHPHPSSRQSQTSCGFLPLRSEELFQASIGTQQLPSFRALLQGKKLQIQTS